MTEFKCGEDDDSITEIADIPERALNGIGIRRTNPENYVHVGRRLDGGQRCKLKTFIQRAPGFV